MSAISKWLSSFLSVIFPRRCVVCDAVSDLVVCEKCEQGVRWIDSPFLNAALPDPFFDEAHSLAFAEGEWLGAIHRFKYGGRMDLARSFALLMSQKALPDLNYDYIIPVPMNHHRLVIRKYNQSSLLAKYLGRLTKTPVSYDVLLRPRAAPPQVGLSQAERLENVKGCFSIHPKKAKELVNKKILLIDDVLTTGATADQAAKTLKSAAVSRVDLLTLARTVC